MAVPLGGMASAQRLRTIAEVEATARDVHADLRAAAARGGASSSGSSTRSSRSEQVICTGEPGASLPAVRSRIEEGFGAALLSTTPA